MCNMERVPRKSLTLESFSSIQKVVTVVEIVETLLNMVERVRNFNCPDIFWRCGKGKHQKGKDCKALEEVCRNCSIKGHFEKVCMKGKCSTHSVDVPVESNNSTDKPDYYSEHGDPVYPPHISVCDNKCKHLIQFLISTKLEKVRNLVESSKCPTFLLKADTGADVNLMNSKTSDSLFDRKELEFTLGWRHMETIVQWKY